VGAYDGLGMWLEWGDDEYLQHLAGGGGESPWGRQVETPSRDCNDGFKTV
jgi:hypothetical protein